MSSTRLTLVGDVNVQRDDPRSVFARVRDELRRADVLFGDLEMGLYRPSAVIVEKPGWRQSEERMVEALLDAGFAAVGCANNVVQGDDVVRSTVRALDAHGIAHSGAGEDLATARAPAVVERGGLRFGLLARTAVFYPHGHAAGPSSPGVATLKCHTAYEPHPRVHEMPGAPATARSWPDPASLEALRDDLRALRGRVDVVAVYVHWGVSGSDELAEYQRTVGHDAVDHGADVVFGSHAHVPQAVELYKGRPILYGLGNFAFDWENMRPHRHGLAAEITLDGAEVVQVAVRPVHRRDDALNQPEILPADDGPGRRIVERVAELSKPLGTILEMQDGKAVLRAGLLA